ncbi:MAG: serine/threonine protein kinase, partial [Myxococcales bacterium]|nr:serine/threonine protein kinase [Myxococcales bacterium]
MLQIGSVLGSYRLTSLLGSGAMGVVYGAQHERSGERAAIKVVGIADEETKLRFEREARALAAIDDPHVVKLLEVGEHRDALYYAMEHLEGHDLGVHMQLHRRMAATDALPYVEQICAGLTAVHARGIVHRDIKPGNVFVCDGLPLSLKLLDFGLARQVNTQHQLTVGGLGTPLFAAPEQVANDGRCDHRADIYALGVVVYRMLSGEMPFDVPETARALAVFMMPLMRDPIPLAQRCPQIDADIARAVDRCLTRDPGQRFDSAAELAASFAAAAHRSRSATLVGVGPAAARAESP